MTKIEQNVMANVALIYTLRKAVSYTALELYIFVASLWALGQLVWVSKVFENLATAGLPNSLQFIISAVLNTEVLVQLTLAVGVLTAFLLVAGFLRATPRTFAA